MDRREKEIGWKSLFGWENKRVHEIIERWEKISKF